MLRVRLVMTSLGSRSLGMCYQAVRGWGGAGCIIHTSPCHPRPCLPVYINQRRNILTSKTNKPSSRNTSENHPKQRRAGSIIQTFVSASPGIIKHQAPLTQLWYSFLCQCKWSIGRFSCFDPTQFLLFYLFSAISAGLRYEYGFHFLMIAVG